MEPTETLSPAELALLPTAHPAKGTPEYEMALAARYLIEGLAYLVKGDAESFFMLGRVAGATCSEANRLAARPAPAARPVRSMRRSAPLRPLRVVMEVECETEPQERGAWLLFLTLHLECGHEVHREMYESQRYDAQGRDRVPARVRCDKCRG